MDEKQLQEQIALYYSKLPADAQAVFSSMKWMDTLKSISVRYGLRDDQIETLGLETTLLLLGIIHIEEYKGVLMNELRVPEAIAMKMLDEIDAEVLRSIRASLGTAYESHVKSLVEDKYGSMNKLDERFSKLPKSVQTAISESSYQEKLYDIANKHKLSIDKMSAFEEVTTKVLVGIIHPDQYESELASKTGLASDEVGKMVTEVNEQILKNIRDILKKHWEENEGEVVSPEDEVPIPPYAITPQPTAPKVEAVVPEPTQPRPLSKVESGIYSNAGIEIVEGMDMISEKLKGITISKSSVSDHSIPKVTPAPAPVAPVAPPTPTTKAHDPYHEAIE